MKVSGFTIIRNAVLMDYPIVESIKSLLPLVDEMVVGVGQSDDATKDVIRSLNHPKLKIFDSHWDTSQTKGGLILSEKTNEALARCANDWCIYLQGDEVLHENDLADLEKSMADAEKESRTQGLLFRYLHFYGSYNVIATSRNWYRYEIRAIKKSSGIQSVGDAQSFRVQKEKPYAKMCEARVFHYGWVKPPQRMGHKKKLLDRWWHGSQRDKENDAFDFKKLYGLKRYTGQHPAVMKERIAKQDWAFSPDRNLNDWSIRDVNLWASDVIEHLINYRIGEYKSYRLIR